jgi:protein-tyrosine phosphatase
MIDFHTHILPDIDDGSRDIEETIQLVKEAKEAGFSSIISTSHYLENYYETDAKVREKLINIINSNFNQMDVTIYPGSEIYISQNIVDFIKEKKASTINNTRYVLFELDMRSCNKKELNEILFELFENKYIPIIAHPERYKFVQNNPNMLIELIEKGVLFQANFGSIIGVYGKKPQIVVKKLLENDMIHFLGSDVHRKNTIYKNMPQIMEELKKIISEDKIEELTKTNPSLVLKNKTIEVESPTEIELSLLDKLKLKS